MPLLHATFTPTGSWFQRFRSALFTCYVNLHIRHAERREEDFYVQIERLED